MCAHKVITKRRDGEEMKREKQFFETSSGLQKNTIWSQGCIFPVLWADVYKTHIVSLPAFLLAPVGDIAFSSAWKESEHSQQRKCDLLDGTVNTEKSPSEVFHTCMEPEERKRKKKDSVSSLCNGLDVVCSEIFF